MIIFRFFLICLLLFYRFGRVYGIDGLKFQSYNSREQCEQICQHNCVSCRQRVGGFSCACLEGWFERLQDSVSDSKWCNVNWPKDENHKLYCGDCEQNSDGNYVCEVWAFDLLKSGFQMARPATYPNENECKRDCSSIDTVKGSCYCGQKIGHYGCECFKSPSKLNLKAIRKSYPYRTCPSDCCAFCANCNKAKSGSNYECDCWPHKSGIWDLYKLETCRDSGGSADPAPGKPVDPAEESETEIQMVWETKPVVIRKTKPTTKIITTSTTTTTRRTTTKKKIVPPGKPVPTTPVDNGEPPIPTTAVEKFPYVGTQVMYTEFKDLDECEKSCSLCMWCKERDQKFSCYCGEGWYEKLGTSETDKENTSTCVGDFPKDDNNELLCVNCEKTTGTKYKCEVWEWIMLKSGIDMKSPPTYKNLKYCQAKCPIIGACYCGQKINDFGCECFENKPNLEKERNSYPFRKCPSDCCAFCSDCTDKPDGDNQYQCDCWYDQNGVWDYPYDAKICKSHPKGPGGSPGGLESETVKGCSTKIVLNYFIWILLILFAFSFNYRIL